MFLSNRSLFFQNKQVPDPFPKGADNYIYLAGSGTYLSQEAMIDLVFFFFFKKLTRKDCSLWASRRWPNMSPTLLVFLHRLQVHLAAVLCPGSSAVHLIYPLNLKFVIGIPNRCCILQLRPNQCFVCNFLSISLHHPLETTFLQITLL